MVRTIDHPNQSAGTLYRPMVAELYADANMVSLGALASIFAVLVTAWSTGSAAINFCAVFMSIVGIARLGINYFYHRRVSDEPMATSQLRFWEKLYSIGAVCTALSLGVWCFVCMAIVKNDFATLVSCTVSLTNLVGVCGRNYPIMRLFYWQISVVGTGILAGGLLVGGEYTVLGLLVLPFLVGLRKIALKHRDNVFEALTQSRRSEKLANRLDTALNNIPQAICMFDSSRRLEMANAPTLMGLHRQRDDLHRLTVAEMTQMLVEEHSVTKRDASVIERTISQCKSVRRSFTFKTGKDGVQAERVMKLVANPMENGGVVATFEDITREVKAENTIDRMTRFDKLTGLLNRDQLRVVLNNELLLRSPEQQVSVLLISLDRFKQVNETMGHAIGDLILCEVTNRLESIIKENGFCARFSGDEFAVVLRSRDCSDFARTISDQILEVLHEPYVFEGSDISIGCSIGISFGSRAGDGAEILLKQADLAMFWAKSESRGDWRVFSQKMSQELEERRQLEHDLRRALANGEFETYYQPIVSVDKKRVTTCEALLRWKHPTKGFVSPAVFIPLAEELGLIEEIGEWVLLDACRACASWPSDVRVAVNLSAVQFRQGDVLKTVKNVLADTGLRPARLELEITESLMLSDMKETIAVLHKFKTLGVRISLDDFGTGYSSLSYMNDLPLDKVKIDRSFIEDLREGGKSLALVQGISAIGRELGLTVVVEGIEEADQLSVLLEHALINEIQGYYFSRPVPLDEVSILLNRSTLKNRQMLRKLSHRQLVAA